MLTRAPFVILTLPDLIPSHLFQVHFHPRIAVATSIFQYFWLKSCPFLFSLPIVSQLQGPLRPLRRHQLHRRPPRHIDRAHLSRPTYATMMNLRLCLLPFPRKLDLQNLHPPCVHRPFGTEFVPLLSAPPSSSSTTTGTTLAPGLFGYLIKPTGERVRFRIPYPSLPFCLPTSFDPLNFLQPFGPLRLARCPPALAPLPRVNVKLPWKPLPAPMPMTWPRPWKPIAIGPDSTW